MIAIEKTLCLSVNYSMPLFPHSLNIHTATVFVLIAAQNHLTNLPQFENSSFPPENNKHVVHPTKRRSRPITTKASPIIQLLWLLGHLHLSGMWLGVPPEQIPKRCSNKIELYAQNMITILSSMPNAIGGVYMTHVMSTKLLMFMTNKTIVRALEIMRKVAKVSILDSLPVSCSSCVSYPPRSGLVTKSNNHSTPIYTLQLWNAHSNRQHIILVVTRALNSEVQ